MPRVGDAPQPGDLIEFFRTGYQHWAVYVGDGFVVHLKTTCLADAAAIHMTPYEEEGVVTKEHIENVAAGAKYRVNNKYDEDKEPRPRDQIVKEAEKQVGKKRWYNATYSNCEHFATELRYGKGMSTQGKILLAAGSIVTAVGASLAIGSGVPLIAAAAGAGIFGLKKWFF